MFSFIYTLYSTYVTSLEAISNTGFDKLITCLHVLNTLNVGFNNLPMLAQYLLCSLTTLRSYPKTVIVSNSRKRTGMHPGCFKLKDSIDIAGETLRATMACFLSVQLVLLLFFVFSFINMYDIFKPQLFFPFLSLVLSFAHCQTRFFQSWGKE